MTAPASDSRRVAEITKRAAEIAALVPEHLQEAAFNRAFDELSEGPGSQTRASEQGRSKAGGRRTPRRVSRSTEGREGAVGDPASVLINSLRRTDHPEITDATRALDRALHLLRIAESEHGIDGMTAPQIAKVLTDKFRQRVSRQAIGQALDAAGSYVDRTPQTNGAAIFRLMARGEKYLDEGGAGAGEQTKPRTSTVPRRKGKARARPKPKSEKHQSSPTSNATSARKRSGRSPKGLVEDLIADGFFDEARTIGDIQERLRQKKGVRLKSTDLSPAMVRLLRENALDRERNESNQYEYRAPS